MTEKFYRNQVLLGSMGKYIKDKVKKPLMKAITRLANMYPEPTRENCIQPNSKILFDIRDKFFEYEDNSGAREAMFKAAFKLLIAEYEHDPYYRFRIDWMLEEIEKSDWEPRPRFPMPHWKEFGPLPNPPVPWSAVVAVEEPDIPTCIRRIAEITDAKRKDKDS